MALMKYLKKSSLLPNPKGRLSEQMPSSSIASANKEVHNLLNHGDENHGSKGGQYSKYTEEEKAIVAK